MEYSEMVESLKKPGTAILRDMDCVKLDLIHMAIGISGEAGELLDAVKKATIYNKPIDRENVIEELGDLEFYMEGLRQVMNISREEVISANMAKLGKRYRTGQYSDQQAQERADK